MSDAHFTTFRRTFDDIHKWLSHSSVRNQLHREIIREKIIRETNLSQFAELGATAGPKHCTRPAFANSIQNRKWSVTSMPCV